MKLKRKIILTLFSLVIPTSLLYFNETNLEANNTNNFNNNLDSNKDSNINENELIYYKLEESLKSNSSYYLNDTSFIEADTSYYYKSNNKVTLLLEGNLNFSSFNLDSFKLKANYNYKNTNESFNITKIGENSIYTSVKYNENIVLFDSNNEFNGIFNFLSDNYYSSLPSINLNSISFSSLIYNILYEIKSRDSIIYDSIFRDLYKIVTPNYIINLNKSDYTLSSIKNNSNSLNTSKLNINLDFSLLESETNSEAINEEDTSFLTTLFSYLKGNKINATFDIDLNSTSLNKSLNFIGDLNLDYTNYDILNNGKVNLNLKEYTNNYFSNDLSLRYQNTNIYFKESNLLKGRINEATIKDLIPLIEELTGNNNFTDYVNNPLDNLLNNKTFKSIYDAILELVKNFDISKLNEYSSYIKNISLRNNLLSFKLNTSLIGMMDSYASFKIGLKNLKIKTISISNLNLDSQNSLNLDFRILDYNKLTYINENEYPTYDFLPGLVKEVSSLINEKKIAGNLELNLTTSKQAKDAYFSSRIDLDLTDASFNDSSSFKDISLALNNLNLNYISKSEDNNIDLDLDIEKLTYQKDDNKDSIFIKNIANRNLNLKCSDIYNLNLGESSVNENNLALIKYSILKKIYGDMYLTDLYFTIRHYINLFSDKSSYIYQDLNNIKENYSLIDLDDKFKISIEDNILTIGLNPTYIDDLMTRRTYVPYEDKEISLYYDITQNKFKGIYINMPSYHYGFYNIELIFTLDSFDINNFVSEDSSKDYFETRTIIELASQNESVIDTSSTYNFSLYDTQYYFSDLAKGKIGIKDNGNYIESNIDINANNNVLNDPNIELIYNNNSLDQIDDSSLSYNDGDIVITETYKDSELYKTIKSYLGGTIEANINIDKDFPSSYLNVYGTSLDPFSILETITNVTQDNLLYPYIETLVNTLNNLFGTTSILIVSLIKNRDYMSILDKEYIKEIEVNEGSDYFDIYLKINPKLLSEIDSNEIFLNDIELNTRISYSLDSENNVASYSIDSFKFNTPTINNVINELSFELISNHEEFIPLTQDTSSNVLDSTFIPYTYENRNEFILLSSLNKAIKYGLKTTESHYFEIDGYLDFSLNQYLSETFLPDLSDITAPRHVNAKIYLYVDNDDLALRNKLHLTISLDNNGVSLGLNTSSFITEYFAKYEKNTSGDTKGETSVYISKTTLSYDSHFVTVPYEKLETIYNNDPSYSDALLNKYKDYENSEYLKVDKNLDYEEGYKDSSIFSSSINNKANTINNTYGSDSAKVTSSGRFIKTYTLTILKDCYSYNAYIEEQYKEMYEYDMEVFKITEDELLGSEPTTKIPNFIYYVLDLSLIDSHTGSWTSLLDLTHDELMGIIYYNISNSSTSTSSSKLDYIGSIDNFTDTLNTFSLDINLAEILGISEFKDIRITMFHDYNEYIGISIYGEGENYTILSDYTALKLTIKLNFVASITSYSSYSDETYLRMDKFINAYESNFIDNGYRKITGYTNLGQWSNLSEYTTMYSPLFNIDSISLKLDSDNESDFTYGLTFTKN